MKAFEIFSWQPPGWPEPHPCVIVSHPSRAQRKPDVEVVLCSTRRATRRANRDPEPHEIILDSADGLDWPTLCKCDLIYAVAREKLGARRGQVSDLRRAALVKRIIAAHGWPQILAS